MLKSMSLMCSAGGRKSATQVVFCLLLASGLLWLTSCRTAAPSDADSQPAAAAGLLVGLAGLPVNAVPQAELLDETPLNVREITPEGGEVARQVFAPPERRETSRPSRFVTEYPENLIKGMVDADQQLEVQFSLDAMQISEIVPLYANLLNFSYLVDPGVKGAVTMTVDSTMTAREVWEMFEHVLWLAGAYASRNPGFVHIMPFNKMPQERRLLGRHDPQANVHVQLVAIFNTKSAEMAGMIQPFVTPGAAITNIARLNSLLVVEAPTNMPKLLDLIEILDGPGESAWPHLCIQCREVDAEVVRQELEMLLPVIGFSVSKATPSGGELKLTTLPRLQVIVASAAVKEVLEEVERWIKMLDREDAAEQESIFFYNVRHSSAERLSEMLSVFFNASATQSTRVSTSRSTSTRAQDTTASAIGGSRTQTAAQPPAVAARQTTTTAGGARGGESSATESVFETPVVVYVDDVQNRLTIRTTQRTYAVVKALLERQDVPPRQVMIEAVIAEITLGANTQYGFAYAAKHHGSWWTGYNTTGVNIDAGLPKTGDEASAATQYTITKTTEGTTTELTAAVDTAAKLFNFAIDKAAFGVGGATALQLKDDSLAFIKAVAGDSNTRIISAPQIMAATGEEARIEVGKEIAVITSEYYGGTTSDRATYEYRNTGTILTVTPYITAGNQVRVNIEQEVSSVIESNRTELTSPDISKKNLRTSLIIPDGGTVMMGGLIDTVRGESHTGIPYLKDIPYLGWLFRSNNKNSARQELLVLITVHVVDPASLSTTEKLVRRYEAAIKEIKAQFAVEAQ